MSAEVRSLHGGPTGKREPNEGCIKVLEEWLERAKAGEVVGVGIVGMYFDRCGGWDVGGYGGGYSMLGATDALHRHLLNVAEGD